MTEEQAAKIIDQLTHLIITTEAICSYLGEAHQRYLDAEQERERMVIVHNDNFVMPPPIMGDSQ